MSGQLDKKCCGGGGGGGGGGRWGTCNGLASHPGGSSNTPSCFLLWKPELSAGLISTYFVHNRYLLKFGSISYYLGYNAMQDFFPSMMLKPNPGCEEMVCQQRQKEYQVKSVIFIIMLSCMSPFMLDRPVSDLSAGRDYCVVLFGQDTSLS